MLITMLLLKETSGIQISLTSFSYQTMGQINVHETRSAGSGMTRVNWSGLPVMNTLLMKATAHYTMSCNERLTYEGYSSLHNE